MVFGLRADLDVERNASEEAGFEVEYEPVAAGRERVGQLGDTTAGVCHAARDHRAVLLQRDRDSRRGTPARRVQDVCGEGRHLSGRYRTPAMTMLRITAGPFTFKARLEDQDAPKTCAAIRKLLPLRSKLVHCRWSGESTWVPMGEKRLGVDLENHTSHPAPGQVLVYPGGVSEMEILFPYGATMFSSKVGQLAGNHFATVIEGNDKLVEIGRLTLWQGAQDFSITEE